VNGLGVIAGYALRESLRRRVFLVVLILTACFLGLYALGTFQLYSDIGDFTGESGASAEEVVGATILGLAMFTTLFLGTVLAVFLTLSAVRGDAESGLLQPLVVRPVGRNTLLAARLAAAAAGCAGYVMAVYGGAVLITGAAGGWWPDRPLLAGLGLATAVIVMAALSLLGSVFLSGVANGIAVFMTFGAGLSAGLLGQIGEALGSDTLRNVADVASYVFPFQALYQSGLYALTADTADASTFIVRLGPFGGAQGAGAPLVLWTAAYIALVTYGATKAFERKDL
jgi:ABC-type transport system involved in multi-copper enzyme maturation permease subunit